jgi:hypothetical protein
MSSSAVRRVVFGLAAGLLLTGCSDMVFYRAKSDYFPLVPGCRWTYDVNGHAAVDSVVGDSALDGRACVVVLRDYAPEYWTKQLTEIRQFTDLVVSRGGEDFELERRYRLVYALPLIEGATWSEAYNDTVVLQGTDSVFVRDSAASRVAAIEDITTPAGTFIQCYRIETHRDVTAAELSFSADYIEWLAPGVGLVKRTSGTEERVLTGYEVGH